MNSGEGNPESGAPILWPQWIHEILDDRAKAVLPLNGVLDLIDSSNASEFYDNQFKNNPKSKAHQTEIPHAQVECRDSGAPDYMQELVQSIDGITNEHSVVLELGGGQYQQRSGCAFRRFKRYVPLDISVENMKAYSSKYHRPAIACDATSLPFKTASIDVIFTHTFLEHPLGPDQVIEEIIRVLKPGGSVFHADAWNCRWWQRYGFHAHDFCSRRT